MGGGAGATGGGNDEVFFESDTNVTTDYTITSGKNAHTVSPVINSWCYCDCAIWQFTCYSLIMALNLTALLVFLELMVSFRTSS